MSKPHFQPKLHHTITPTLTVRDAKAAIEFYKRAFGAQEISCMASPDGKKVMHAEVRIGDSMVMLNDEMLEMNCPAPETLKGVASSLFMYVENCDETFKRAIDCGATSIMKPEDMFWGDRFSKIADPFGQQWSIATHIEDLNEKEIEERQKAFFASAGAR